MAYVAWLHRDKLSRETAGGKGSSLSAMISAGFAVPGGFSVTADGYRRFLSAGGLGSEINSILNSNELDSPSGPGQASEKIVSLIQGASLPEDLRQAIAEAYDELSAMTGLACAVRSSAVSEDGSAASFAGLFESYLNVIGMKDVLADVQRCYASLWSERAIRYRSKLGDISAEEAMAVVIMGLVKSETSGIAFTAHPVTGSLDQVVINASWGLGEAIVSGSVTPDSFVVAKDSFRIVKRDIFEKGMAIFPHPDGTGTIEKALAADQAAAASLTDDQACEVARLAAKVEAHYGSPQDIEFGMAGGQIFLLQSRPITTLS